MSTERWVPSSFSTLKREQTSLLIISTKQSRWINGTTVPRKIYVFMICGGQTEPHYWSHLIFKMGFFYISESAECLPSRHCCRHEWVIVRGPLWRLPWGPSIQRGSWNIRSWLTRLWSSSPASLLPQYEPQDLRGAQLGRLKKVRLNGFRNTAAPLTLRSLPTRSQP